MRWTFNPEDYVEKKPGEAEEITTYEEPEEEYEFSDDDWPTLPRSRKDDTQWDAFRKRGTIKGKIDAVIESLISGTDDKEAYMTREEIGTYLRYLHSDTSVANIHKTNADVLDALSEKREVPDYYQIREKIFYSPKGVYEIMCHSKQKRAGVFFRRFLKIVEQKRGTGGAS